jgi:hypothetical protein
MLRAVRVFLLSFSPELVTVLATAAAADRAIFARPASLPQGQRPVGGRRLRVGSGFTASRRRVDYGYQIAGSLWLDLRFDMIDATTGQERPCAGRNVATFTDVLGGIRYKLQTDIPLVPYAGRCSGRCSCSTDGAAGAFGVALRVSVGAKYFLYEWLGLGDRSWGGDRRPRWSTRRPGCSPRRAPVRLGIGAEIQF